jgi:hypothetical protein
MDGDLFPDVRPPSDGLMECISLWQPWATWIAWGWKTVETRTHDRFAGLVGKRIAIHAAQKFDDSAFRAAQRFLSDGQYRAVNSRARKYPRGAVICTVEVYESRVVIPNSCAETGALIECASVKRYGLFLRAVRRVDPPISMRGRQGIFKIPPP